MFDKVDALMFTVVRLKSFYNDKELSRATGFFYHGQLDGKPNYWLVTNWHVLTGRNASNPIECLHPTGATPNRLELRLILAPTAPEYGSAARGDGLLLQEQSVSLYDGDGHALWAQHSSKHAIDIGTMNVGAGVSKDRYFVRGVNEVATTNDMAIEVGNDVIVLGYPLGFSHFIDTPIWKKGSIASEPHFETPDIRGRVVIDATTRAGMSGSPVFMRATTHYVAESGEVKSLINATRFIGIYASRPNLVPQTDGPDEDRRAEVGYIFKSGFVHETITLGVQGPDFGSVPSY